MSCTQRYWEDDSKWSENHHYYGLGVKGAYGAFTGSMIFEATDAKGEDVVKAKDYEHDAYSITAGGNYNFGVATPFRHLSVCLVR